MFDRQEHAVEVNRRLPPPVGEAHLDYRRCHNADPGIGDQNIESPNTALNLGDDLLPALFVGDVLRQIKCPTARRADLRDKRGTARVVDIADRNRGAFPRQGPDAGGANPRRPAGNECDLSVHLTHSGLPPSVGRKSLAHSAEGSSVDYPGTARRVARSPSLTP